jgi:hypothetical protein
MHPNVRRSSFAYLQEIIMGIISRKLSQKEEL